MTPYTHTRPPTPPQACRSTLGARVCAGLEGEQPLKEHHERIRRALAGFARSKRRRRLQAPPEATEAGQLAPGATIGGGMSLSAPTLCSCLQSRRSCGPALFTAAPRSPDVLPW